jgi:hypothetical protein
MEGGVRMTTELKVPADLNEAPPDRVRAHSNRLQNQRIDAQTQQCLQRYAPADREAISRHIDALNREWDVERYLQMNAGIVSLSGVVLGAMRNGASTRTAKTCRAWSPRATSASTSTRPMSARIDRTWSRSPNLRMGWTP